MRAHNTPQYFPSHNRMSSLDTSIIQLRKVYARTPTNQFIPSSHILISGGDGSTSWNSVSSIMEVSSFKTLKGNTATTFSADLYNSLLRISTTGVQGTLESYVENSTLMLSNYIPPIVVAQGSVPVVSMANASNVPNPQTLTPVSGLSTLKFLGVGDIRLSTINSQNATFIAISSYTAVGYSTISGETFQWRPTLYSTLSTAYNRPSFISSVPFATGLNAWNWGSNLNVSTGTGGRDMYFSSITFQMNNIIPHIDLTQTSSTRLFVNYSPSLFFSTMVRGPNESLIKEISTYIQIESPTLQPPRIFQESVITSYLTSQQSQTTGGDSNYYTTPTRHEINPYTSFLSNYVANNSNTLNFTIYHRLVNADVTDAATQSGFSTTPYVSNLTSKQGGLYIQLINQGPLPT